MQNVSISSDQNGKFTINIEGITKEEMQKLSDLIPTNKENQVPFILTLLGMVIDIELRK